MIDRIPDAQLLARLAAVRAIIADENVERLVVYGTPRRLGGGGVVHYLAGWSPHESQQKPLKPGEGKMRLEDALNTVRKARE